MSNPQTFRSLLFGASTLTDRRINITQFIGAPLYWINRELFYSYMALTKQSFGLLVTTMTHWWSPTLIRISGDASVAGQITQRPDGLVEFLFPERLVLIANHQVSPPSADLFLSPRTRARKKALTGTQDIHRLALPLVGRLCE